MKSHAFITLAILFAFFVLAKGEESDSPSGETWDTETGGPVRRRLTAEMSDDKLMFNRRAVGAISKARYEFDYNKQIVTGKNISIVLPHFSASGTSTATVVSGCGGTTFTASTSGSAASFTFVLTAASADLAANVKCIVEFGNLRNTLTHAANPAYKVSIDTDPALSNHDPSKEDTIGGTPTLYALRSTCKSGGVSSGATATSQCTAKDSLCQYCGASGYSFFTEHVTGCSATAAAVRCDAHYFTDSAIDVYFNTGGIEGIAWCAAYTTNTKPVETATNQYSFENDPDTHIQARNSVLIDVESAYIDHVISLTGLAADKPYAVFCHMDDVTIARASPLDVWTAPNINIWDDSLVRSNVNFGDQSGTLTLTFTHGAAFAVSSTIKLTTNADIFDADSGNPTCSATNDGSTSFALHSTPAELSDQAIVTFTTDGTNGASTAGSTIIITCSSKLQNPASAPTVNPITYTLEVTGHNVRSKRKGPKFE
jgi:hypothetical protein